MVFANPRNFSVCLAVMLSAIASAPQTGDTIDIASLIKEVKQKSDANWKRVVAEHPNYTYKWRKVWREADKKGKVEEESELNELFYPTKCAPKKCRRAEIKLEENGKPLPAEKIEKQRAQAVKKLEKIESHPQAASLSAAPNLPLHWMKFGFWVRRPFSSSADLIVSVDGQEVLEKCEFSSPSREFVNGREAITLNFSTKSGAIFSKETAYMPETEGRIWIDAEDRVLFQLAIWRKGTKFSDNNSRYLLTHSAAARSMTRTAEGLWFPAFGRVNGLDYPKLFLDMNSDFSIESFDYHYFQTEVKNVEVSVPPAQNF